MTTAMSPTRDRPAARVAPYVSPGVAGAFMDAAEFDSIQEHQYEPGYRYELIHGVLVVSPIPSGHETGPNELLGYFLLAYKRGHPNGSRLDDTLPQQYVRTSAGRRIADRLVWCGLGRMPNRDTDLPAIAVEIVSAARRDRVRDYDAKRGEYMAAGIQEYWIIDRFQRIVTVITPGPSGPVDRVVTATERLTTPLLPGLEIALDMLFEDADRRAAAQRSADGTNGPT